MKCSCAEYLWPLLIVLSAAKIQYYRPTYHVCYRLDVIYSIAIENGMSPIASRHPYKNQSRNTSCLPPFHAKEAPGARLPAEMLKVIPSQAVLGIGDSRIVDTKDSVLLMRQCSLLLQRYSQLRYLFRNFIVVVMILRWRLSVLHSH